MTKNVIWTIFFIIQISCNKLKRDETTSSYAVGMYKVQSYNTTFLIGSLFGQQIII